MRLLDAINISLTAVGEPNVTSESAPSPSIGLIKNNITHATDRLLARGWWFNDYDTTLSSDIQGFVFVPANTLEVRSMDGTPLVVRDSRLFDVQRQSYVFTEAVAVQILATMAFAELPEMAAQVVAYEAAAELYSSDLGEDDNHRNLMLNRQQAYERLFTLNLRNRRYSTSKTHRARRLRSALIT